MPKKTLQEVLDFIDSMPELMCGRNEAKFLYELSKKTKGAGTIVEIGTCSGKSTIALAYAQKEKNGHKMDTIDIRELPDIQSNLYQAGVSDFVNRIIGRSSAVAKQWLEPIEILFIDGDHRYIGIVSDIKSWSDKVLAGGMMVFHDYPKVGGRVVNQTALAVRHSRVLSKPHKWRILHDRDAGNIFVCQRINETANEFNSKTVLRQTMNDIKANLKWYFEEFKDKRMENRRNIA